MRDEEENKDNPFDLFPLGPLLPSSWSQLAKILGFVVLAIILISAAIAALIGVVYLSNEVFEIATQSAKQQSSEVDTFAKLRNSLFILAALIGVPFFLWRTWIARRQSLSAENQAETARDRAYTELFTKAIEQLGAEKPKKEEVLDENGKNVLDNSGQPQMRELYVPNIEVRIGAIYALERIMKDSEKDAPAIVDTLAAYVRENCGEAKLECEIPEQAEGQSIADWIKAVKHYIGEPTDPKEGSLVYRARNLKNTNRNRADIKTALTVIGRRPLWLKDPKDFKTHETQMPDLRTVNLLGWDLSNFDLSYCNLSGAKMQGADMQGANMLGANLKLAQMQGIILSYGKMQGTNLTNIQMQGAKIISYEMQEVDLSFAEMQGIDLMFAQLKGANLSNVNMDGAVLTNSQMRGTNLSNAWMQGADLSSIDMQSAYLNGANMKGANLSQVKMQGAKISNAQMQGANMAHLAIAGNQITSARKTAASVIFVYFTKAKFNFETLQAQLPEMLGHKEHTILPEGMAIPEHWSEADMSTSEGYQQYDHEWAAFKKLKGVE